MLMLILDERSVTREWEDHDDPTKPRGLRDLAGRLVSGLARMIGESYLQTSTWGADSLCASPDYFVEAVDEARRRRPGSRSP